MTNKFYQVSVPVVFHGFNFRPGYVWGRETSGAEFASSGWSSGGEIFIYRRLPNGKWVGGWETPTPCSLPRAKGPSFCPASEAAQIVLWYTQDNQ